MFFNSLKQKFQVRGFFLKCVNFAHPLTKVLRYATGTHPCKVHINFLILIFFLEFFFVRNKKFISFVQVSLETKTSSFKQTQKTLTTKNVSTTFDIFTTSKL